MKLRNIIVSLLGMTCSMAFLSGCAAGMFEEEIKVEFINDGELIDSGVVTQFKNHKSPVLDDAYVPTNYKFVGWTTLSLDQLDLSSAANFKKQYLPGGSMVHYKDAKPYAVDGKTTYNAIVMHVDDIPVEYHYAVVAWYDKTSTSGINADQMDWVKNHLATYLTNQGVSADDVASVDIRGYSGDVGTSTGQINLDGDVDVMFGWGSVDNVTNTGSIDPNSIYETVALPVLYNGDVKNRTIHRISDDDAAKQVMGFLTSQEVLGYFNPQSA